MIMYRTHQAGPVVRSRASSTSHWPSWSLPPKTLMFRGSTQPCRCTRTSEPMSKRCGVGWSGLCLGTGDRISFCVQLCVGTPSGYTQNGTILVLVELFRCIQHLSVDSL